MSYQSYRYHANRRYRREHPAPSWNLPLAFTLVLAACFLLLKACGG